MKKKLGRVCWQAGFSLIELLVVISIIGVLTAVLVMNLVGARERSRDSQKIQDLNSIKSALRMYYNDNQVYPSPGVVNCTNCLNTAIGDSYLPGLKNSSVGYSYSAGSDGNSFVIKTTLESSAGDNDTESQIQCRLTPTPGVYAVCAN